MGRCLTVFFVLLPIVFVACVDDWARTAHQEASDEADAVVDPNDELGAAFFAGYEVDFEQAMERLDVPGAAVAVVTADRVIYSRGFGYRSLQRRQVVTEDTLFRVGTVSRALALTMLGVLVDEGRLEWDHEAASGLRLDRLLDRVSGAPIPENEFLDAEASVEELLAGLGSVAEDPELSSQQARDAFAAAIYDVVTASGDRRSAEEAFHRLMHTKVFSPAGMARTAIGGRLSTMGGVDYAEPYGMDLDGEVVEIESPEAAVYGPVSGIASTLSDMARFVSLQLGDGITASRKRVVSPANLELSRGVGAPTRERDCEGWAHATPCRRSLGWSVADLPSGDTLWLYRGGVTGYCATLAFLEQRGVGWVVLNNKDPELGGLALGDQALDLFLARLVDLPWDPETRLEEHRARLASLQEPADEVEPVRPAEVRPFLGAYAGGWHLSLEQEELRLLRRMQTIPVVAYGDGYLIPRGAGMGTRVRFRRQSDGTVRMAFADPEGGELASFGKIH